MKSEDNNASALFPQLKPWQKAILDHPGPVLLHHGRDRGYLSLKTVNTLQMLINVAMSDDTTPLLITTHTAEEIAKQIKLLLKLECESKGDHVLVQVPMGSRIVRVNVSTLPKQ